MSTNQVTISSRFFANAPKDYSNPVQAFARELVQNCMDAPGSSRIDISVEQMHDGHDGCLVTVSNNGDTMTHEILVGKLLSLGESGKTDVAGSTGLFGKAKELIYFFHVGGYVIETGNLKVIGSGGNYELETAGSWFSGTRSTVNVTEWSAESVRNAFRWVISHSQWAGIVRIDGVVMEERTRKGRERHQFSWGVIHTNRSRENLVVVRINGIVMFTKYTQYKHCVVIELKGRSDQILTSNRDSLLYFPNTELDAFLQELAVNKTSALNKPQWVIDTYGRGKIGVVSKKVRDKVMTILDSIPYTYTIGADMATSGYVSESVSATVNLVDRPERESNEFGCEFKIKNGTGKAISKKWRPGPDQCPAAKKLVTVWVRLLKTLLECDDKEGLFSVGFIFSADRLAEHSVDATGTTFYINPMSDDGKTRYKLTRDKAELISLAAHEYVHFLGKSWHDEDYARELTRVLALCVDNHRKLMECFRDLP